MNKDIKKGLVPELRFPEFMDSGEWTEKTLGKICEVLNNRRKPITSNKREKGNYPYYGASGIVDYISDYIFDERLLLIGEDGAKWGAFENTAFIAEGKYWVNNHAHVLRPVEINDTLLENYLVKLDLNPFITGAAPPKLTLGKLKEISIPFPLVSKEQTKIAACLSSLDDLITAQTQKIEALKIHKKGLMQQLFPQEGETVPKLRFPEFRDSGEWNEKPLGKIAEIITGNTPQTSDSDNYGGNKMFVSPADISDSRYIVKTKTTLSELGYSKTRYIPANSVLFVCIGSTIGKIAQNKFDCATNQQINSVVPFKNYSSDFLYFALDNDSSRIAELAGRQAVPIINKSSFSAVSINIPPEEKEQTKIANCLSSLDELINAHVKKCELLKTHKKGLMQGLFPIVGEK